MKIFGLGIFEITMMLPFLLAGLLVVLGIIALVKYIAKK